MATPISTREPESRGHVDGRGAPPTSATASTVLAPEQRGQRQQPQAERQHARVEVRLEGVGAGARDAVAQREGGHERRGGPGRAGRRASR